jgi:DNA polymerase III epsilon subunit-like protein
VKFKIYFNLITNQDLIAWGKKLLEKAEKIQLHEVNHKTKVIQILDNLREKFNISENTEATIEKVEFRSYMFKGFWPGQEEVKYYWLNYILNNLYSYKSETYEESIRNIIENENLIHNKRSGLIEIYNSSDFYDTGEFKLAYPGDKKNLNIFVPYSLSYYQVYFATQIIENLTKSKVNKISFWYFKHDPFFSNTWREVTIAIDDDVDKYKNHPYITKDKFLNLKPSSFENWYEEIPVFQNYIQDVIQEDLANWPECPICGEKNDLIDERQAIGRELWFCEPCGHMIDRFGNCDLDVCETCEKANLIIINEDTEEEFDYPECKTCGDANDVSDPGGSYWWCSHCEHSIDQNGDCVSDECETCEKDPFIALNGPFYLFFDTETTGVPRDWKAPVTNFDNWPRIVQLAWLIYDSNGTQILKNEFIIKPSGFEIPIEASNVHGITTEFALENGVPIEEALLKFEKNCEKSKYLIAHNINFDSKVISSEYLRIFSRNPISKLEKMCTMESSTNYCKIPGNYGYKWPKLSELHVKLFGVDFEGAHDALADIEATAKCFWEMRKLKII